MAKQINIRYFRNKGFVLSYLPLCLCIALFFPALVSGQQATFSRQFVFKEMSRQRAYCFLEDSRGFIWIGGNSLYRFDGYTIRPFDTDTRNAAGAQTGAVYSLLEDRHGRLWVGAASGLFRYDRATDQFIKYPYRAKESTTSTLFGILSLFHDKAGRLWFGDESHLYVLDNPHDEKDIPRQIKGIDLDMIRQGQIGVTAVCQDKKGNIYAASRDGLWMVHSDFSVDHLLPDEWKNAIEEFKIIDMAADSAGLFWLATTAGLWMFDAEKRKFSKKNLPASAGQVIKTLRFGPGNELWLGAYNKGLIRVSGDRTAQMVNEPGNPYSLVDNNISALLTDRFGNLWIGTQFGISRINFGQQNFPFYQLDPGPHRYSNYTHRIMQDSQGGFWIRSIKAGLVYCPGPGEKFKVMISPESGAGSEEVKNFCTDQDGNVWVITLTKGLYKFDQGDQKMHHFALCDSMSVAYTLTILSDRTDQRYIWFNSVFGLCRLNRFTLERTWFYPTRDLLWLKDDYVGQSEQSEDGNIWFSFRYGDSVRIACFDKSGEKFISERKSPKHTGYLVITRNYHMKSMKGNNIWIGTQGGVVIIDATTKTFTRLTKKDGFPLKNVLSITPDLEGNIWFTGDGKICKYDGKNYQCQTAWEGIENFAYSSAALGRDGRISFGGTNGIYSFYPKDIQFTHDTKAPRVCLTAFEVFNENRQLGRAYEQVNFIRIPYKENVISFEFSALHFLHADRIKYEHRLLGFEKNWVETGSDERKVTYTNLSPGNYTFQVRAANADGVWTPEPDALNIVLTVLPPWYRTWWAWLLYLLAAGGILLTIRRYELRRQLARAEIRQLKELDTIKTQLYTNITHEFRTPLTIIDGMADQIADNPKEWLSEGIRMIKRNDQRLLLLVNQMLDLSKIESGSMPVRMVNGDIVLYLRYIAESFHSYAEIKQIDIRFSAAGASFNMDFDPEKLLHIVSNLLSNAIKYTPDGGNVHVHIRQTDKKGLPFLELKISDTGVGIAEKDIERIFDRFYQADNSSVRNAGGTGIGLALTSELVKLMEGTISVESREGKGSTFIVLLPVRQEASAFADEKHLEIKAGVQPFLTDAAYTAEPELNTGKSDLPLLLIIEDNQDVVRYLESCLRRDYRLAIAGNGQAGIDRAIELVPDIIISDVMMPLKDGFEVCRTLKQDERTSHIPFVLLTAKADTDSVLEGLELGADAYLAKPFNRKELNVRLKKLIELRQTLQEHYRKFPDPVAGGPVARPIEDAFLKKVILLTEQNISDAEYGLEQLCRAMHMSRSQLFRKLKALTGKSTSIYIRSIRLHKARELLRSTDLSVSEIAYDVGFTSPAYFTRAFAEEFGVAPSQLR